MGNDAKNLCKVIYIYRNPEEVFISYWKFLHRWDWFEGPKLNSPLELMKINPKGQSQRYQIENYKNYFARWASHVIDAQELSKNSNNILLINYDELKNNFKEKIQFNNDSIKYFTGFSIEFSNIIFERFDQALIALFLPRGQRRRSVA